MSLTPPTFATLHALHAIIGNALDDIQRVFSQSIAPPTPSPLSSQCSSPVYPSSPEPSPCTSSFPTTPLTSFPPTPLSATFPITLDPPFYSTNVNMAITDYPSPDVTFAPTSLSEQLAAHPDACLAASRIVAACGQLSSIVHKPFLSLCDALMGYNVPACLRLVEHLHIAEILREAENHRQCLLAREQQKIPPAAKPSSVVAPLPGENADGQISAMPSPQARNETFTQRRIPLPKEGLHVTDIANVIHTHTGTDYVDPTNLVHALRLLSTHHIFRETAPDTFATTRVASLLDSGKGVQDVFLNPETKYENTDGTAAFVGLCTDELFKSAAYLTEAFTGVQLPVPQSLGSASRPTSPLTSSNSFAQRTMTPLTDNHAAGASNYHNLSTRSSSALTHVICTNDEDERLRTPSRLALSKESFEDINSRCPLPNKARDRYLPLASTPLSPHLPPPPPHSMPVEESTARLAKEGGASEAQGERDTLPAFNLAFRTTASFFDWLESGSKDPIEGTGRGAGASATTREFSDLMEHNATQLPIHGDGPESESQKPFRLERFSKAMTGTSGWEAPGAILSGFDWNSLLKGSTIVDVGGGIGSTTMFLARAFNDLRVHSVGKHDGSGNDELKPPSASTARRHRTKHSSDAPLSTSSELQGIHGSKDDINFRFIVQDKPVVTSLGIAAWRSQCPEMLESGQVEFQGMSICLHHDFFQPQPSLQAPHLSPQPAVYLLRVVLHDWPDSLARRILINLRVASAPETRLIIADHVLPLACVDEGICDYPSGKKHEQSGTDTWTLDSVLANIEGAEQALAPPPLLPNLGKAGAIAYWMDLSMHIAFNAKERTLRELTELTLSAGWRITRMTRPEGSLFAHLVCEPIVLPGDAQAIYNTVALAEAPSAVSSVVSDGALPVPPKACAKSPSHTMLTPLVPLLPSPILERSSSRCGTPTFGSRMLLPRDDELQGLKSGGGGAAKKWLKAKGLGVRSVVAHKAESQKGKAELPRSAKGSSPRDEAHNVAHASPSHTRVWWKKSLPNSTNSNSTALNELDVPIPEQPHAGRGRRGTITLNDIPSTPLQNPRVPTSSSVKWPTSHSSLNAETAAVAAPEANTHRSRRPSVASITRKLSFATFSRKASATDLAGALPTPPYSATFPDLAPPPSFHSDNGRRHLPSSPALGCNDVDKSMRHPAVPRRPSLIFADHASPKSTVQSVRKPYLMHGAEISSPPSGILIMAPGTSPSASQQGSPKLLDSPQRQRSATALPSSSEHVSVNPKVKRAPNTPRLPRRLSIPLLRRKQSNAVLQDEGGEPDKRI
ncbi:hypothetical protein PAXRUDRAFT_9890 [Paxillus rubicundulus Ve08.2h10]|uniref:O-methyltransferase domain-containing protein n=1 Tax=Paxillus rubicundulus Ve08.2h10 TaxID=930991 RepID=A0A0D0E1Y3_9AGAM|nr:hypothetical protein PAXRUDRAFT_9890 [Paxillus rubicundulus Ve08.2h10]